MAKKKKKWKALVIVESPKKADKISGYLGDEYQVVASVGHVRDLPSSASEIPEEYKGEDWVKRHAVNVKEGFQPLYVVSPEKKKVVREIKSALKDADELIIATDEDREGESIGWHLVQLLEPKVPVKRMVFSEITKEAILKAIENPRDLDEDLVEAQETRRVVDRLFGYELSPLLWRKIKPKLSAGRVQSVAVRLLVQRELERLAFHSGTYWDLKAQLAPNGDPSFEAMLQSVAGKKIASGKDFDEHTGKIKEGVDVLLLSEKEAGELQDRLREKPWVVQKIEERKQSRKPAPPFTTSTLQMEANRKLNMSTRQTMGVAQRLYENGLITYMRTDSVNLSQEALDAARSCVKDRYGNDYLSDTPRQFTSKSKSAQEAHEAIRPAGTEMPPAKELGLKGDDFKLYELIWKRTVATQMAEARLTFQTVTIKAEDAEFRASGRHIDFPGFFRAYVEGSDDPEAALDDQESALPPLEENQTLSVKELEALSHETKPPARYTEASLVGKLENEGIGRPSTYSSIIGTIQDRGYVRKSGSQLVPTFTAVAVTRLLENYFPNLVDYNFTARMEQTLDDIATGEAERLPYLENFYSGDEGLEKQVEKKIEVIDPREACTLQLDGLHNNVRVGKFGPYFERENGDGKVTASIPDEMAPADLSDDYAETQFQLKQQEPKSLGTHPEEGLPIYVKSGPYGPYVQLGEPTEEKPKPKRVGLTKAQDPENLTFEEAVELLSLPKRLGHHPETGKVVKVGVGMYGPYVLHDKTYGNFDKKTHTYEYEGKTYDVMNVTLDAAVDMLKHAKKRSAPTPIKELGKHPDDEEPVAIFEGRYGPYVKHKKLNATIPKDKEPEKVTFEEALGLLEEKAAKKGTKKKKKSAKKKATSKKKKKAGKKKKKTAKNTKAG